jgi:hypothetical protein
MDSDFRKPICQSIHVVPEKFSGLGLIVAMQTSDATTADLYVFPFTPTSIAIFLFEVTDSKLLIDEVKVISYQKFVFGHCQQVFIQHTRHYLLLIRIWL